MATTAGEALLAYLRAQLTELRRRAPGVLAEQPEDVHQMRVAARRLRSLLASGRPLFDEGAVDPLRDELRWLSGLLGAARDPGVVHERLDSLLAREPEALRFGPAATRIDEELDALAAAGFLAAIEALASERYDLLLAALEQFLAGAPQSPAAAAAPGPGIGKLMARDERRLRRAVNRLTPRSDDGEDTRDAGLHEVRKAAKRLRYSAELAASLPNEPGGSGTGKKAGKKARNRLRRAKRTANSARRIQQLLGLHQDSVVARARLAELGGRALRSGENGFSYGRLHAKEEALAAAAERAFLKLWAKFPSSS
ncbi:CHAD domain-containing protein [Arthrobacter sp. UKPF54-2]|uniref:CHAD domain-containing protein n=1 Tax=Arthrobacter sp. UKPF54-2 TaxID=2600159 RepID=UPI0011B19209|nr:CHAD domain-containing protein [Arthrobacter sp. UKPF54-2]QDY90125.1 CHAD domain-containing protein [Arthrobacter sp. UKPF54-2]